MTEQAFYIPHLRTRLPDGNSKLQEDERRDREYDNERRLEQEMMIDGPSPLSSSSLSSMMNLDESDDSFLSSTSSENDFEKEMATYKSNADRQLLQTIFDSSPDEGSDGLTFDEKETVDRLLESVEEMKEDGKDLTSKDSEKVVETDQKPVKETRFGLANANIDESNMNEAAKNNSASKKGKEAEIIQSIAKPMATGDWSKFQTMKKNKPRPKDNPILRDWKKRLANSPSIIDLESKKKTRPLPPFPSNEHFVGIWKLDSTPGGKVIDEEKMLIDPNASENMVLRVDRTVGGGPILDTENLHRAAGGTWKFFQAQYVGPSQSEGNMESSVKTRLRIRLLIPPRKERVLVFEGEVKQGGFASAESISQDNINELRKSSFSNLIGQQDNVKSVDTDASFLQCSGEMWLENVRGDKKRSKVGKFTLSKRQQNERNYQYSIPAPQRYQD